MSVIQCYCPTCRRTVYAEDTEAPECPVCLSRVFVAADDTVAPPGPTKKEAIVSTIAGITRRLRSDAGVSGEAPRGLGAGGKRKDSPTGG